MSLTLDVLRWMSCSGRMIWIHLHIHSTVHQHSEILESTSLHSCHRFSILHVGRTCVLECRIPVSTVLLDYIPFTQLMETPSNPCEVSCHQYLARDNLRGISASHLIPCKCHRGKCMGFARPDNLVALSYTNAIYTRTLSHTAAADNPASILPA